MAKVENARWDPWNKISATGDEKQEGKGAARFEENKSPEKEERGQRNWGEKECKVESTKGDVGSIYAAGDMDG